jgi:hypothetical protein
LKKNSTTVLTTLTLILFCVYFSLSYGAVVSNVVITSSGIISSGPVTNFSYIIYQSGGVNYIQNSTGYTVYSSANANLAFSTAFGYVATGGTLTVEAGTYTATGTSIVMANCDGVTVNFLPGSLLTIQNWLNISVLQMNYDVNCVLTGINVNGNGQNQYAYWGGDAISVYDCSNCLVTKATLTNCATYGWTEMDDSNGASDLPNGITNSVLTFCAQNGINLGSSFGNVGSSTTHGAYAINDTVGYSSDVGITNYGVGDKVIGCYVYDMNGTAHLQSHYAIAVEGGGEDIIENNQIVNCNTGIMIGTGTAPPGEPYQGNYIAYNNLTNCTPWGICISHFTGCGNDVITNNTIRNTVESYAGGSNLCGAICLGDFGSPYSTTGDEVTFNSISTSVGYANSAIIGCEPIDCAICNNTITVPLALHDVGFLMQLDGSGNVIEGNIITSYCGIEIDSGCSGNRFLQNNLGGCTNEEQDSGTNELWLSSSVSTNTSILTLANPTYGGSVSPLAGSYQLSNSAGSTETITLTPNSSYTPVLNVDGSNVTLTNNQYTLNMGTDHTVYTLFQQT